MTYTDLFQFHSQPVGDIEIAYRVAGDGPPLLLLHGFPQTNMMWHKIAPRLAEHYRVIAADLRGYGDSGHPASDDAHAPIQSAPWPGHGAADDHTCPDSFMVAGHDRGGRVARLGARPLSG